MTDISKTEGIRELTSEEIDAVAGGLLGGPLSSIFCQIKQIVCQVEHLLSCFGQKTET
jgi:hypothetical protein